MWARSAIAVVVTSGLAAACASARPAILGEGRLIREVDIVGAHRFSKDELLEYLYAGETSWIPTTPDYPFDEALFAADAGRVVELYRAAGFLDAEVARSDARIEGEKVKVSFTVREGEPTRVARLAVAWDPAEPPAGIEKPVAEQITLGVGKPFEVAALNESVGGARLALLQRGYPLARVRAEAEVQKVVRQAEVTLHVSPGPHARFGRITFVGLAAVPAYKLDAEVEFALGQPYSPAVVRQVEDAVKSTRVFRWVSAEPPEKVEDGVVDLVVRVSEADPEYLGLALQLSVDTIRWQEQVRGHYTHTNPFGDLTRFDFDAIFGWAEMPNPADPTLDGPVLSLRPALTNKGLLEKHLLWTLAPAFDVNLYEGYQYYSPTNRMGVSRWFAGFLRASLTHNLRRVDFFNVSPRLSTSQTLLGRDFRNPYFLSYLEAGIEAYWTNSIVAPTDGLILDFAYDLAGGVLAGNYDYQKVTGGARAYWHPFRPLQVAARLRAGLILPYGADAGAPFDFKFYLGGADAVRGWGSRRLSPRIQECGGGGCETIPVGGYSMIHGSLELRLHLFGPMALVGFVDLGDVQAKAHTFEPADWNLSAGPGLRADTPLGLVRLDVGFRLNDPGVYTGEGSWALHFGLGETF